MVFNLVRSLLAWQYSSVAERHDFVEQLGAHAWSYGRPSMSTSSEMSFRGPYYLDGPVSRVVGEIG